MMKWVEKQAKIPFELPNLPHLNDDNVKLYKQQIREREEQLHEKRMKDLEDMEREDRVREEMLRKSSEKKSKQLGGEYDSDSEDSASTGTEKEMNDLGVNEIGNMAPVGIDESIDEQDVGYSANTVSDTAVPNAEGEKKKRVFKKKKSKTHKKKKTKGNPEF